MVAQGGNLCMRQRQIGLRLLKKVVLGGKEKKNKKKLRRHRPRVMGLEPTTPRSGNGCPAIGPHSQSTQTFQTMILINLQMPGLISV